MLAPACDIDSIAVPSLCAGPDLRIRSRTVDSTVLPMPPKLSPASYPVQCRCRREEFNFEMSTLTCAPDSDSLDAKINSNAAATSVT